MKIYIDKEELNDAIASFVFKRYGKQLKADSEDNIFLWWEQDKKGDPVIVAEADNLKL